VLLTIYQKSAVQAQGAGSSGGACIIFTGSVNTQVFINKLEEKNQQIVSK